MVLVDDQKGLIEVALGAELGAEDDLEILVRRPLEEHVADVAARLPEVAVLRGDDELAAGETPARGVFVHDLPAGSVELIGIELV
ncbi:MAG: hypothetical protein DYG93_12380 [Leptolyngbya sp. PLA2]|nr:hypothetical protein [Leptolyngbya sp. PL-A2]